MNPVGVTGKGQAEIEMVGGRGAPVRLSAADARPEGPRAGTRGAREEVAPLAPPGGSTTVLFWRSSNRVEIRSGVRGVS